MLPQVLPVHAHVGNGLRPFGFTNLRPEQITGFMVTGIVTPKVEPEMATKALAEAASSTPKVEG